MNKYVLDASALLALLNKETGYDIVAEVATYSVMSTVNVCESITTLQKHGFDNDISKQLISNILADIIPFDLEHALTAAQLNHQSKQYGLSFGDRACLSTAIHLALPVLTADKIWSNLKISTPIQIIR